MDMMKSARIIETTDAADNILTMIFDTGGVDLMNFAANTTGIAINLTPGATTGAISNNPNVIISETTIIENATTGRGNDTVTGNDVSNIITAGAGNDGGDTIDGGAGRDTLDGGAGGDRIEGGAGQRQHSGRQLH